MLGVHYRRCYLSQVFIVKVYIFSVILSKVQIGQLSNKHMSIIQSERETKTAVIQDFYNLCSSLSKLCRSFGVFIVQDAYFHRNLVPKAPITQCLRYPKCRSPFLRVSILQSVRFPRCILYKIVIIYIKCTFANELITSVQDRAAYFSQ